jgi:hypothetical protein
MARRRFFRRAGRIGSKSAKLADATIFRHVLGPLITERAGGIWLKHCPVLNRVRTVCVMARSVYVMKEHWFLSKELNSMTKEHFLMTKECSLTTKLVLLVIKEV